MCVDYTDLNKACPKDCYPLQTIDQLVDSTICHSLCSFIDVAQGYYQILIKGEDQEKTSFITHEGLCYYKVMNDVFKDQIGKNVEVYVDEIIVKIQRVYQYFKDLDQILCILD